ncbi:hypothetical protein C4K03_3493 [Pseudomonas synxantha]|uniref:Peptidase S8/S53 domain-containing protein n=1 Tax=Pseudomonas synxantha TaxID=47883 RepID=A0A3G7UAL1_9PSED|nr:S8 family serine peptidase [Pseudomonas synxantha]AZE55646.1 hypothetical protein C4K03_3493 [Pseudomonas synxantha]
MTSLKTCLSATLLLAAVLTSVAHAETPGYTDLIILLKSHAHTRQPLNEPGEAHDPCSAIKNLVPNLTPIIRPSSARSAASLQALQRHRLDRYCLIDTRHMTQTQAEQQALTLRQHPAVEMAEFEPVVDGMHDDNGSPLASSAQNDIPDYTPRQHYLLGQTPIAPYKIGGVNAVKAWEIEGGKGQAMRVISGEIDHWSYEHWDLPHPYTELHSPAGPAPVGSHDTASAGIIASQENGFGTTGLVPHAQLGYLQWSAARLGEMGERLQAGDVMQLGVHYLYSDTAFPPDVCTARCYMPLEANNLVRDTIAYLTEEKGVHVVLAAANGNINLDHPHFQGRYDRNIFDSGSIFAGAVNSKTGLRSYFSEYGSRVDLFSWGDSVTTTIWSRANPTTGYTHEFGGTSSANPILAGAVASLQGVARAKGVGNIAPKTLRAILVATGYPQINGNRTEIGVQPDLQAAIAKMLADHADRPPTGRLAVPEEVKSADTFSVHVYAESPTSKPLTYRWNAAGFIPTTGTSVTLELTAPTVKTDTSMPISVEVSDGLHTLKLADNITIKAGCGNIAAWDPGKIYDTYAESVAYKGQVYKQNFYNVNKPPDLYSGPHGQPWFTGVVCP